MTLTRTLSLNSDTYQAMANDPDDPDSDLDPDPKPNSDTYQAMANDLLSVQEERYKYSYTGNNNQTLSKEVLLNDTDPLYRYCTLHMHCLYAAHCTLHMHCLYAAHCTLHMHCVYAAHCTLHMHCTCTAHALHMHCKLHMHCALHCTCTAHTLPTLRPYTAPRTAGAQAHACTHYPTQAAQAHAHCGALDAAARRVQGQG